MGVKSVTRGGWVAIGVGALAVGAAGAFAGEQYANKPLVTSVDPLPGAAIATTRPLIGVTTRNVRAMRDLKVTIDGRDRTDDIGQTDDGKLVLKSGALKDGVHQVAVSFATNNVFSRRVEQEWEFTVDTKLPPIRVASPTTGAEVNAAALPVSGRSEPGAQVTVAWNGGSADGVADASGKWTVTADLPEGAQRIDVTARDAAGNASVTGHRVIVDTTAPKLQLAKLPAKLTETDLPTFSGTVTGERPARAVVGAIVNGREIVAQPGAGSIDAAGAPVPGVTFTGSQFELSVGRLPQGTNTVRVFVRDRAGNQAVRPMTLLVDSTEELGEHDLIKGARGADVRRLQQDLRSRGFKRTKVTGVYDNLTALGVRNYQRVRKIKQSGAFGPRTRLAFMGRIVVDLSSFKLRVIRDGKVVKTYPIAHGTARYPTPVGTFRIVNKQKDPTWTPPPDSDWAKGLGPIPPGPGNPLGTRWMGTSAQYVGIHGTPASGSIGTRASHGCIRMRITDAEALYEEVIVGMPVQIQA